MSAHSLRFGKTLVAASVALGCGLGAIPDARATLGGDRASVAGNEQHLVATRQVLRLAVGERHELTLPSGLVVREYVSPGGAVYAVTWSGPRMPDLRELLGGYFAQLGGRDAAAGHHRMSVTGADFAVRSTGHRHHFAGRAWVPSLVPAGVQLESLE
jgi:hypothetical protein